MHDPVNMMIIEIIEKRQKRKVNILSLEKLSTNVIGEDIHNLTSID